MPETPTPKRLFFALWPSPTIQAQIVKAARPVLKDIQGRRVAQDNLHLTLAFLGSTESQAQARMETAVSGIVSAPFELELGILGYWPRPQVVWLAPPVLPDALSQLHHQLNNALEPCGYRPETRPFAPHMTLLRKVRREPLLPGIESITWPVDRFTLVESRTYPEGVSYHPLRHWDLK